MLDAAGAFPWWLALILAAASYLVLHQFTTITPAYSFRASSMPLVKTLAYYFQYIVPAVFVLSAVLSLLGRRRSKLRAEPSAPAAPVDISWRDFEHVVADFFRQRGFSVDETAAGVEFASDLLISSGEDRYVVRCKDWRAKRVGSAALKDLHAVMTEQGAVGAFVVASGEFTEDAQRFAEACSIELIPARQLIYTTSGEYPQSTPARGKHPMAEPDAPDCPLCGAYMLLQTVSKGVNTYETYSFWGCSMYPACRGTRTAEDDGKHAAPKETVAKSGGAML
jgi:restriction system protein